MAAENGVVPPLVLLFRYVLVVKFHARIEAFVPKVIVPFSVYRPGPIRNSTVEAAEYAAFAYSTAAAKVYTGLPSVAEVGGSASNSSVVAVRPLVGST